jgi:protein ImuB
MTQLRELIERGAAELGAGVAWAPTGLGALALARCEAGDGFKAPWQKVLDTMPLTAVTTVAAHQANLACVGYRPLGDVRNQPRAAPGCI